MTITPGKNFPNQTGFPTPDTTPETSACRTFRVPDNDDWLGLLMGAVQVLTKPYNFYQWGSLTPEEAASAWNDIIVQTYEDALTLTCPTTTIDTPFWDDATDVDAQDEKDMQPWYGEVTNPTAPADELDFVENALIWFFTGLIALGTAELAFAPAILFNTIAPKFVLAMKRGDVGEIIRIVVDGQDNVSVDTTPYSAGDIINIPVIADPSIETHSLLIIGGITP